MGQTAKADLSEFFKLSRPKKKPCQVAFVLGEVTDEEADQLRAACEVDKGLITAGAIREWCAARGHELSIPAVTGHRHRTCTCHE